MDINFILRYETGGKDWVIIILHSSPPPQSPVWLLRDPNKSSDDLWMDAPLYIYKNPSVRNGITAEK